jgi:hypothetical protein
MTVASKRLRRLSVGSHGKDRTSSILALGTISPLQVNIA